MTHTPTPWHTTNYGGNHHIFTKSGYVIAVIPQSHPYKKHHASNAARIVQCVNSHDALVAALEAISAEDASIENSGYTMRAIARAALAKAKGE